MDKKALGELMILRLLGGKGSALYDAKNTDIKEIFRTIQLGLGLIVQNKNASIDV